jgi:hypothetical protein
MERLWIREVRRAARRASAPFARHVAVGWCGVAAIGALVASLVPLRSNGAALPLQLNAAAVQAVWGALWAVAAYVASWTGLFTYHLGRYRASGFRDRDWFARHDDSDPHGAVFLELVHRSGGGPAPGVDLVLCVKSHGNWQVVDSDGLALMPDRVIRCRFDLNHEVVPGGFYEVRWLRADDRGRLVEITRERFQLRKHLVRPRRGSGSRMPPSLATKALPISEEEAKPRRAVTSR